MHLIYLPFQKIIKNLKCPKLIEALEWSDSYFQSTAAYFKDNFPKAVVIFTRYRGITVYTYFRDMLWN